MKKSLLLAALCGSLLLSNIGYAQVPNKMTYEKAIQSHKNTFGKYQEQSVTAEESQTAWDSYQQEPKNIDSGSRGQLTEVWTGNATSVLAAWGQGDYYVEIEFDRDNQGGGAWVTVDNSSVKKNVAIPSPFQYEGNYHIQYESGTLKAVSVRASGTPKITRISKFPSPQLNECTSGQTESNKTYCSSSKTCATGLNQRSCASNGGWLPWQTIRNPVCVSQNQSCP